MFKFFRYWAKILAIDMCIRYYVMYLFFLRWELQSAEKGLYMQTRWDLNLNQVCVEALFILFHKVILGLNLNSSKLWWSHSASFISSLQTANITTRATQWVLRPPVHSATELGNKKLCWLSQVGCTSVGWRGYLANKMHLGNSISNYLILQMRNMNRILKPRHISWKL